MRKSASIAIFFVAVLLFFSVVAYTFRSTDIQGLRESINLAELLELCGLGLMFHLSFGLIMWVGFKVHYGLELKKSEILTLPMMMHLFLYLMPIKGGMLFQVFYTRHKYSLDLSKGFSLGMMIFLNSLLLTIGLGLVLIYFIPIHSNELKLTVWTMAVGLVGMLVSFRFLPDKRIGDQHFVARIVNFLIKVRIQLEEQSRNWKLFIALGFTTAISTLIQALLFWKTALVLGVESLFLPVLLVVLVLRIVLLARFVPGNLGVQEMMIGVVFASAGFALEDGLLIGVVTRLISVLWTTLIGLPALYSNLGFLQASTLKGLLKKVEESNK